MLSRNFSYLFGGRRAFSMWRMWSGGAVGIYLNLELLQLMYPIGVIFSVKLYMFFGLITLLVYTVGNSSQTTLMPSLKEV